MINKIDKIDMTKHPRSDEESSDQPLQYSIKKLKLGNEELSNSSQNNSTNGDINTDISSMEPSSNSSYEGHLRQMNLLLGALHFLRLGRKAEKERHFTPESSQSTSSS